MQNAQRLRARFIAPATILLWVIGSAPAGAAAIQVVRAIYGPNCGVTNNNAGPALATACDGRLQCSYVIDFHVLGDPAPGCPKTFLAEWRCNGGAVRTRVVPAEAGFSKTIELTCAVLPAAAAAAAAGMVAHDAAAPVAPPAAAVDHADAAHMAAVEASVAQPPPAGPAPGTPASMAVNPAVLAAATHSAAARHLEIEAVQQGAVSVFVQGHATRATLEQLPQQVATGATFVTRTQQVPTKVALSSALKSVSTAVISTHATELPLEISGVDKVTNATVNVRARIAEGTGLLLDASLRAFVDTVYVYLVDRDHGGRQVTLKEPASVMIQAVGATASPTPVMLSTTEKPEAVSIRVIDPQGDEFPVTVRAGSDDAGDTLRLKIMRPHIKLASASPNIVGWGIETTTIFVDAPALARDGGYQVALTTEGGGLDPALVPLDPDGHGKTTLHSDHGSGAVVSVANAPGETDTATVSFRQPWLFFLMAALGGLVGAFLRGKGRRHWPRALTIGVVTAVAAAILYAAGITGWVLRLVGGDHLATSGEAVVFAIGFLAALGGVSAFVPGLARDDSPKGKG